MPSSLDRLTVHRLAARTLIRSLEMEEMERRGQPDEGVKKKVVELSVQSGVSSTFTAFIAVNKGNGETIQGPLVRRNVPTSMPMMAMCGGGPPGGRMMGRPMPRMMSCSMPMRTPASPSAPMVNVGEMKTLLTAMRRTAHSSAPRPTSKGVIQRFPGH